MRGSEYEARIAKRNQLSAVDVLGSFDFSTAIIYLKSLVGADIDRAKISISKFKPNWNDGNPEFMTGAQYSALSKVNTLVAHEYTHFIDATSTLWGLRHLELMSEAYTSIKNDESNYYKAKAFSDHVRSIRLPAYYTVIHKTPKNTQPWQSKITIGRVFSENGNISNRAVLFSQFLNADGKMIVRSPVSTVSILEASAMSQEVMSLAGLLRLTDPEYRLIEDKELNRKVMAYIYSQDLTEYSVCVHILANKLGCTDVLVAFEICASLTRIALNFPTALFDKLANSCPIEKVLDIPLDHVFGQGIRDGLRGRDLGTIYYLLCNALPVSVLDNKQQLMASIRIALHALGIEEDELIAAMGAEAGQLAASLNSSEIEHIVTLAQAGYENFKIINYCQQNLEFQKLNLPPAILGDDSVINVFAGRNNSLSEFDVEDCFFELDDGMSWVSRFSEACL